MVVRSLNAHHSTALPQASRYDPTPISLFIVYVLLNSAMKTAASQGDSDAPRSEKRRRVGRGRVATQPHPLGIKPHANLLVSSPALAEAALAQRRSGLGALGTPLPPHSL